MFALAQAHVHYGASSYPLTGLPADLQLVSGTDPKLADRVSSAVGRITGYPRAFAVQHCPEATYQLPSGTLRIPERLVATANGYTLTWNKAE